VNQDRIVSKETLGHRRVVSGLSPENARPLGKMVPKQRYRQRFVDQFIDGSAPREETPSRKGRNARIRAMKRDKRRIAEFKERALS
jgi:hypothetical protein